MIIDEDIYLEHYGVRGMRWGVSNDRRGGVSRKTDKAARKDAQEFARAKMYYGTGAGTRRKLIGETVKARRKKDPDYARAFDSHLEDQDMSSHASRARSERGRTDRRQTARRSAGSVARRFTGEMGTTAAFTAAAIAGGTFLNSPRGRNMANQRISQVRERVNTERVRRRAQRLVDSLNLS